MRRLLFAMLLMTGCASYKLRVEYPDCVVPSKNTKAVEVAVTPQIPSQAEGILTAIINLF